MKKKKSFIKEILIYLLILTSLLFVILGFFLLSSYGILENEIKESSDAFLKIYSNEFSNSIAKMDVVLQNVTAQGEDLAKLKSSSESQRSLATISLHNYMQDFMADNEAADEIVVYDSEYGICVDAKNTGFGYKQKNQLRDFTCNALNNKNVHSFEWNFLNLDNETYMYKMLVSSNRAIAVFIRTSKLLHSLGAENNGDRSIAVVNNQGMVGTIWGNTTSDIFTEVNISKIDVKNYYEIHKNVVPGQLDIYCYTSKNVLLQQTHSSMVVVGVIVLAAVVFMLFILRYAKKEILNPMRHMVKDMESIKDGEYEKRIGGDYKTKEFLMLQETTNQMVDEIVGLKIQSYEKRIALQDMELKSIRLQLKPHFFLNALTTISSLNSQNKRAEVKAYIEALSKNVRYMFRAGFHTVPVKEEIRHVKNYFEMQELKYPGCIFYMIDLPQELEEWKIPQMLVHTFIENEYKYAISIDQILTILIKVSRQQYKGEETLLIEIEDDGRGYPQEVLDYMNGISEYTSEKGTRIGLWSIKRMLELMYERNDLISLENISPHGCLNRIYVPLKAKHEL